MYVDTICNSRFNLFRVFALFTSFVLVGRFRMAMQIFMPSAAGACDVEVPALQLRCGANRPASVEASSDLIWVID